MATTPSNQHFFTDLVSAFDANILNTINSGSAQIISLISPVMMIGFGIYLMLVTWGYWRGLTDEPMQDFLYRMVGWAVIITLGMNISYYSEYVVPFLNGLGDDISQALAGGTNPISALDSLLNKYIDTCAKVYDQASGWGTISAVWIDTMLFVFGGIFMAIAAAYLLLAKFALGLLLALGPLFISLALFPATREYFSRWVAQCMNYVFLVCLFAAAGVIECNFAASVLPPGDKKITITQLIQVDVMGIVFVLISLNLPGIASQLAGGVGISSMVGKMKNVLPRIAAGSGNKSGAASKSGGSVNNKS